MSRGVRNAQVYGTVPSYAGKIVTLVVIIVVAFIAVSSAVHIVPPGNRGVYIVMGRIQPQFKGEGFTFKVPFVSYIENISIRQETVRNLTEAFSKDLQNMQITYDVLFRIPEAKVVELFQQYRGDVYSSLVDPRLQESIKQTSAQYRAEDMVQQRQAVKGQIVQSIQQTMKELVIVNDVTLTDIGLSDLLESAIEQKVIREQEALAKNFELEKARMDAKITVEKAKAEAEAVQIKGEALKASPEVVNFEIAQKWDGKAPQSVVVTTGSANVLLPLR